MCGIAGIASFKDNLINPDTLKRMRDILKHRGPDDEGLYLSRQHNPNTKLKVGLGHRRLSIIDLESGHQPMSNEDKTIWIVHNGEIYNFPELREELIGKGHRFSTKSDTEVIIHLYEEKGEKCLDDLRGMFAFCIWDVKKERIFLARDRIGQKPVVYFHGNGIFLFGSEIKSILENESIKRELDLESLDAYLSLGYVPSPLTIYKGIKKLPPAHYLIHDGDNTRIEKYWRLSYKYKTPYNITECQDRLYELLGEATKMRLISDVPLGAFLSGGVDSSCIVALMSKFSSKKVKTFSIGFTEESHNELKYARFISKRYNTDHKEFIIKPKALEVLPKLAWHYEQPFGDSSCIPTYYVSKIAREFVTVALNGDGGDESFAGYPRYTGIKLARLFKNAPKGLLKMGYRTSRFCPYGRRFFAGLMDNPDLESAYFNWLSFFTESHKRGLYTDITERLIERHKPRKYLHDIFEQSDASDPTERMISVDTRSYLPEDLLVKIDIATMASSLEGRSPFLDHKVMEFAASLPLKYKLNGLTSKYILKKTFGREIPIAFLNRKKKGFSIPVGEWFRNELKGFVEDMLLDTKSLDRGLFSRDYIEGLLKMHQGRREDHTHRIWALLSFELWHRIFIEKRSI